MRLDGSHAKPTESCLKAGVETRRPTAPTSECFCRLLMWRLLLVYPHSVLWQGHVGHPTQASPSFRLSPDIPQPISVPFLIARRHDHARPNRDQYDAKASPSRQGGSGLKGGVASPSEAWRKRGAVSPQVQMVQQPYVHLGGWPARCMVCRNHSRAMLSMCANGRRHVSVPPATIPFTTCCLSSARLTRVVLS